MGGLDTELPYGFAWALVLDSEAAQSGLDDFHAVAAAARDRIMDYLTRLDAATLRDAVADQQYGNVLWPIWALHRWAARFNDAAASDLTQRRAAELVSTSAVQRVCTAEFLRKTGGFFSPCHLLFLLASEVRIGAGVLAAAIPAVLATIPLRQEEMPNPHSAGLNFSRAWGLMAGWRIYHDPAFLDAWTAAVSEHLALEQRWRYNYSTHAHWIAQFGVFAVATSYEQ